MSTSISIYAAGVETTGEGDQVNVFLKNVDVNQVVKEFTVTDVLEALAWEDIMSYVTEQRAEAEDE